jgi:hypothetical protein
MTPPIWNFIGITPVRSTAAARADDDFDSTIGPPRRLCGRVVRCRSGKGGNQRENELSRVHQSAL